MEYIKMSDNTNVALHSWLPDDINNINYVIVISHGMTEYGLRYEDFAKEFIKYNCAVYAHDHRGHGYTANTEAALGYLADKYGFVKVVSDLSQIIDYVKLKHPNKKVFVLGHSFGSFVLQSYIEDINKKVDGCILSGTAGPRVALGNLLKNVSKLMCFFFGKKNKAKFLTFLSFGTYTKRIPKDDPCQSWLSRDGEFLKKYESNKYCGFVCSNLFYVDLGYALATIHLKNNIKKIPIDLPILFITGTEDPVGGYTKTVKKLASIYRKNGIKDVKEIYYEGARHEPLNEINRQEVYKDVIQWIKAH